jgi:hypothetical protein
MMGLSQSKPWYRRLSYSNNDNSSNIHQHQHQQQQNRRRYFDVRDLILVASGAVAGTLAFVVLLSMVYTRFLGPRAFVPDCMFCSVLFCPVVLLICYCYCDIMLMGERNTM